MEGKKTVWTKPTIEDLDADTTDIESGAGMAADGPMFSNPDS